MYEQLIRSLQEAGWMLEYLEEGNLIRASHLQLGRGLILCALSTLPHELNHWTSTYPNIKKWDVIIFCFNGIDSSRLKQHFPNTQHWYLDTQFGNLFPYPPTSDKTIPYWLRQMASGKPAFFDGPQAKVLFKPFITVIFLGINILVFILMVIAGPLLFPNNYSGLIDPRILILFGAKVNILIQAGELWRLFTCMFIHLNLIHLAFNLYALWTLGSLTEESLGHRSFLIIYILSGLGGSIASYIFSPALSAGASGAIFGLLGALLYYSYTRPAIRNSGLGMNLVIILLVNFGLGLLQPGIDNFAHLGGLITGSISSVLLTKRTIKMKLS